MHNQKDPFLNGLSAYYPDQIFVLDKMAEAVSLLTQYDDYQAFCKSPLKYEHTICHVSEARLFTNLDKSRIRFHISSNRFLAGMIRIIMGKLLEIGRGNLELSQFEHFLKSKTKPETIIPVYAQGLYLSKVTYPYLDLPVKSEYANALFREINIPV